MTLLKDALKLAELGWQVFALGPTGFPFPNCRDCRETCTTPAQMDACDHLICHGCYAGTTDVDRLNAMWEHLPHSIIGIRTGLASGLFVLDFDLHTEDKNGKNGFASLREQGILRRSVAAETGGGGRHLYYKHPGDLAIPNNNRGRLAPGVDIKGEGGYVVAAPSAKKGKLPYLWVPGLEPWNQSLASLDTETLLKITKSDSKPVSFSPDKILVSNESKVLWAWESALTLLETTTTGSRNEALYRAACRGGEVIATGQVSSEEVIAALEAAGADLGLTPGEIRQTIRSGLNRGHHDFLEESV